MNNTVESLSLEVLGFALDQRVIVSVADVDGLIVDANAICTQISGYTREELLGQDVRAGSFLV